MNWLARLYFVSQGKALDGGPALQDSPNPGSAAIGRDPGAAVALPGAAGRNPRGSETGGNPSNEVAVIDVVAQNDAANSMGVEMCVAPIAAGAFAVLPARLAALPATPQAQIPAWGVASCRYSTPARFR